MTTCARCGYTMHPNDVAIGVDCPKCGPKYVKANKGPVVDKPIGKRILIGFAFAFVFLVFVRTMTVSKSSQTDDIPLIARTEAQGAIRLARYRCDTVTHIRKLLIGTGYSVQCDNYIHNYTITDVGGRIMVEVD